MPLNGGGKIKGGEQKMWMCGPGGGSGQKNYNRDGAWFYLEQRVCGTLQTSGTRGKEKEASLKPLIQKKKVKQGEEKKKNTVR